MDHDLPAQLEKSPSSKVGQGSRGPHAVRREATRLKAFEATIACLYEGGYAQTSTLEVAKRADISRGALLKQFPTRAHLFAALVEHIVSRSWETTRAYCERFPAGVERVLARADSTWAFYKTPQSYALMEIALGARSDPQLSELLSDVGLAREHLESQRVWEEMRLEGVEDGRAVGLAVMHLVATVRGLMIERLMNRNSDTVDAVFALEKQRFETVLRGLIPSRVS
jgi:AcrR family transcriptional regulator